MIIICLFEMFLDNIIGSVVHELVGLSFAHINQHVCIGSTLVVVRPNLAVFAPMTLFNATPIVVDRLGFSGSTDTTVVEFVPRRVGGWTHKSIIVTTASRTRVDKNGVKMIHTRLLGDSTIHVLGEIKNRVKAIEIVDLVRLETDVVHLPSLQLDVEHRWKRFETHTTLGILEAVTFCTVLVLTVHELLFNVLFKRLVDISTTFHH
mmetsp:Transcript_20725/g.30823  ORF Transcript_20725/g.30823 Transcript_20725/m.30823 type:complete len:206 (-) Transcript_20725:1061-1678(-)